VLGTGSCADSRGEVMLIITTDLNVPVDFNHLEWSVTIGHRTTPYRSGDVDLESEDRPAFPMTLAVVSGPDTDEEVLVRVAGTRRIQNSSSTRVERSARLVVPTKGVRELWMPLDFLCSTANADTACEEGETCKAGKCESDRVDTAQLSAYDPDYARDCYDVEKCFASVNPVDISDNCVIQGTPADSVKRLALVVDAERAGNWGVCTESAGCRIPLPEGPGGFERKDDGRIQLPEAVCAARDAGLISRVDAGSGDADCRPYESGTPLCRPAASCIPESDQCPAQWGSDWHGASCSGNAAPETPIKFLAADADPNTHFCWSDSRYQPHDPDHERDDAVLIDDMTGGAQLKIEPPEGYAAGLWWTSYSKSGTLAPAPKHLFDYRRFDPPWVSDDGKTEIASAACVNASDFFGYSASEGFDLNYRLSSGTQGSAAAFDASAYRGLTFYAKVAPRVLVLLEVLDDEAAAGENPCDCPEHKRRSLDGIGPEWQPFTVDFAELDQSCSCGPLTPNIYKVQFSVLGIDDDHKGPPFDLCISQIYFTKR
jgi:hypothetical protein